MAERTLSIIYIVAGSVALLLLNEGMEIAALMNPLTALYVGFALIFLCGVIVGVAAVRLQRQNREISEQVNHAG